jgi:microcystin-dependent protein
MADGSTPFWGLTLPEIGSSRNTWGSKLNADLANIDAIMAATMPIGAMIDFAGAAAPTGWLLCDGSTHPIASFPKLAAVLGTLYGGDGTTTFGVPDSRGRVLAGVGSTTDTAGNLGSFTLGEMIGWFYYPIDAAHLPAVAVTIDAGGDHTHSGYTDAQGTHQHGGNTDGQGNHAHQVTSPSTINTNFGVQTAVQANFGTNFIGEYTDTQGNHAHNLWTSWDGNHAHNVGTYGSGPHTHTGRIAGGGTPLPVYQPILAATKIIFCGPPGLTTTGGGTGGALLLRSPMRGLN